jgi:tRNA U34 2-thiouridine synthase MnmA/TrmU
VVGPHEALAVRRVTIEGARLHRGPEGVKAVRLRYGAAALPCSVREAPGGGVELELEEPAHAVAPGQLACLLADDLVTGYGTISQTA